MERYLCSIRTDPSRASTRTPGQTEERPAYSKLPDVLYASSAGRGHQTGTAKPQRPDGVVPRDGSYVEYMAHALKQQTEQTSVLFAGLVFYINGYLDVPVNSHEMKQMILGNGGTLRGVPNASIQRCHYVHPKWVLDCIERKLLLKEDRYSVVSDKTQPSVLQFLRP
ncbi:hypothetical protein SeMB42_g06299 [Synchytrium endobioticum]|uniref:BRCT domain-containing protein n=1 Tax=Synchytrium endobioticum TaxID=286115 RepID=A0A507CIV7_9FUNG|nr:hypothetical protein SeLEV6574_g07743 [Synchytrium endobioticum]TPX39632.1 hypothetical protein SeMB42_g06299 [Synchytrium endobioticum]